MKEILEIVDFLEKETGIEDIEFIERDNEGLKFTGFKVDEENEDQEVEVFLSVFNVVYVDGVEQDIYLPFNVWGVLE